MIKQLNPICAKTWHREFSQTEHYAQACGMYKHVISSYREMSLIKAAWHDSVYDTSRAVLEQHQVFDIVPHYYIKYLLEISPNTILDIGCGENIFKKIYPNIVGMDSDSKAKSDLFDHFDQDFVNGHVNVFDAVITINTVHFTAVTDIQQQLKWIHQILKPGGRAFVSTNLETWLMHTSKDCVLDLFPGVPDFYAVLNYVHQQAVDTGLNFLVMDYPALSISEDSTIRDEYNGNLRWVFTK